MRNARKRRLFLRIDDIAMFALALVSGILILVELTQDLNSAQITLIERTDMSIAFIFLCEFGVRFILARKKLLFFRTFWWELLASIPITTPVTQVLRLLRLLRLGAFLRIAYDNETDLKRGA